MNCKHCGEPVRRCERRRCGFYACRGHVHSRDQQHSCEVNFEWHSAEPEPGSLPTVEAPAGPPAGAVA